MQLPFLLEQAYMLIFMNFMAMFESDLDRINIPSIILLSYTLLILVSFIQSIYYAPIIFQLIHLPDGKQVQVLMFH
ncbi:hypothetical protein PAMP_008149 [Pampus punctatissimus]